MNTGPRYAWTTLLLLGLLAGSGSTLRAKDREFSQFKLPFTIPLTGMRGDPVDLNRVSGLALTVEDAGWPAISMLRHGMSILGGSPALQSGGSPTPAPFSFGTVRAGGPGHLADQQTNEVSNTLTFQNDKHESLKVTVTRLSPAILLESGGRELELFGGCDEPAPAGPSATAKRDAALRPPLGTVKPLRWATPAADGRVHTGILGNSPAWQVSLRNWDQQHVLTAPAPAPEKTAAPPVDALGRTWLLLWYGRDSLFLGSKVPTVLLGTSPLHLAPLCMASAFQGDVPLLIVFEKAPQSIALRQEAAAASAAPLPAAGPLAPPRTHLVVTFAGPAGKVVMLPLFGHDVRSAATTEGWLKEFPAEVRTRCDAWARRLGYFPVNVKEETAYDEQADRVTCTETFAHVKVRPHGEKTTLVRPMLALGLQQKLPAAVTPPPLDLKYATQFGPLMAVAGQRYEWHVDGLGKYVSGRAVVGPSNEKSQPLEQELSAEVDKVLAAGHLAPWFPWSGWATITTSYGKDPAEAQYFLSEFLPVLPAAQQAKVRDYLAKEAAAYPPHRVLQLKFSDGARREFGLVSGLKFDGPIGTNRQSDEYYEPAPSLFRAYGVARGCISTDRKPAQEVLAFWRSAMRESLAGRDWATLGWFRGKYAPLRGWSEALRGAADYLEKYRDLYRQYTPRALHRDAAGLIGYLRLCRMAGEKGEPEAWGQLARLLTMRFALAHYGPYLAESGLFQMPRSPDVIKFLSRSGDFSRPENHLEQVWEVNQHEVTVLSGASKEWKYWYGPCFQSWLEYGYSSNHQIIFLDLTPEVGRILADWGLKEDVARFVRHYAEVQAIWPKAHADNEHLNLGEGAGTLASDSYQYFLAHAWIAGTPPQELEQYIDEPWVAIGDYFFMHKLAETIKAYRGVKWEAAQ